jgi:glycosyltransferase involved in cell wall biosynthesis
VKNVLIFTSIERAFYSSIIEYQLLEPMMKVSKRSKSRFTYVGFIPVTFWFTRAMPFKSFMLYRANRIRLKRLLFQHGICCTFVPIIFPIRNKDFYLKTLWLLLYVVSSFPVLLCVLLRYRTSTIHARNYPAALICLLMRYVLGIPYVFDMRDLYPEKGIEAGMFSRNSWSYRMWKRIELRLVYASSSIITTSVPFRDHVRVELHAHASKIRMIPNCVNTDRFSPDQEKRKEVRARYGLTDKLVLVHSGAFGTPQDLPVIGRYLLKWMRFANVKAHLVILCGTREYLPHIRGVLAMVGVPAEAYTLINPLFYEVPELLLLGDIGLHLETMAIATPYCIAVKDGEYMASGLPVVVTPWLRGIRGLIEEYDAGIVVDPGGEDCRAEERFIHSRDRMRENGLRLVKERLSLNNSVEEFLDLYSAL